MIYGFMVLAAIVTAVTPRIFDMASNSAWSAMFVSLSIILWAISAFLIYTEIENAKKEIEELQKKVEELEKHYDDKKD